ncbi:MAG: phenylalanine--tRNA ligase subunit alpha [Deltaproteobacteria bacterium CG11_big_fil_rev_8_21_14_0_20_49_13]|nr:MAG: phenylalanine--tRNA ligase subunit alpha [Deltaproteobacteria bacterium CG11_big_fil_rev_8_21_14_0_20_49_13]
MLDLQSQISNIEAEVSAQVTGIKSDEDLKLARAKYVGKKGVVTGLMKFLGQLDASERPEAGKKINTLKSSIIRLLDEAEGALKSQFIAKALKEKVDITLPGRQVAPPGRPHPVTQVMREIEEVFTSLGFSIYEGSEIETDYYNFEALNVPKDHPARDMQDTFYISSKEEGRNKKEEELLLRTHTSPVQIHVMKKFKPPIRMIFPGAVYRKDADITHSPMFHQVEGLMVGDNIRMSDLKGVLITFVHRIFGEGVGVRFRPSFFPFTEPSAEIDIECVICHGKKQVNGSPCRVCKQTGWMEILGCGMVDPNVFEAVGYDPKKVSGFAFGMGVERITMLKFGVSDIRLFFENDLRFLKQF